MRNAWITATYDTRGKGPDSSLILYQAEDGSTRVEMRLANETVWLIQKQMAELFQKDLCTINEHIQNIYAEGELNPTPLSGNSG